MHNKKNKEKKEKIKCMLKKMLKYKIKILKLVHTCNQIFIVIILVFIQ